MTEIVCNKQTAIEYLKDYCEFIKNGKITLNIFNTIKSLKETLSDKTREDVVCIDCGSTTELTENLAQRLQNFVVKDNIIALVFIGHRVSGYSIRNIKTMFDGCVKPIYLFPEPTADDHIKIFLCFISTTEN